jgi:opacity protein-like surface antigen
LRARRTLREIPAAADRGDAYVQNALHSGRAGGGPARHRSSSAGGRPAGALSCLRRRERAAESHGRLSASRVRVRRRLQLCAQRGGPLDLRFDLAYAEHNASNRLIASGQQTTNIQVDGGTGSFWSATGNLVYRVPLGRAVRAYALAGVGAYHERIELTQSLYISGAYGGAYYCDPFYYYCDGVAPADVVASHDVTKFGWNAGIGIEFPLYYGGAWFIEARYHRIETTHPIEYIPLEIGYRF